MNHTLIVSRKIHGSPGRDGDLFNRLRVMFSGQRWRRCEISSIRWSEREEESEEEP